MLTRKQQWMRVKRPTRKRAKMLAMVMAGIEPKRVTFDARVETYPANPEVEIDSR